MQRGAPPDESEDPVAIEGPPPLARLAALMALVDLFWNRVVVRVINDDEALGIALQRGGVFPRNLAAVAGLISLAIGVFTFLRMAGYSGLGRRLGVSSIAGLLMPAFVLALVIPKERVSIWVVVAALLASNALVVLIGTVSLQYRAGMRRWATLLVTLDALLVLTGLVIGTVRSIAESAWAAPLGIVAHHAGEIAWHIIPLVILVALFRAQKGAAPSESPLPGRGMMALAGGVVVLVLALALFGESQLHAHRFGTLVYGALRLTLIPPSLAWLNGLTVGIAVAAAAVGMLSPCPARVQLGAAAALWVAAGSAPHAPGQLLDFALAGLLLARAAQAATIEGRARARMRWGPLQTPTPMDDSP